MGRKPSNGGRSKVVIDVPAELDTILKRHREIPWARVAERCSMQSAIWGCILQSSITGRPILANGEWRGLSAGEHDCSQEEFNAKVEADAFPHSADKRDW